MPRFWGVSSPGSACYGLNRHWLTGGTPVHVLLFARDLYIGHRPQYLAAWKFSCYADLDAWGRNWAADEEGRRLARELSELSVIWDARILTKLL